MQYAQIIQNQNERLNQQVEKVLNIAKLGSDNFRLKKEVIDLNAILKEVATSKEPEIAQRNGAILYDLAPGVLNIAADPLHFGNVLLNLIDNAIKYSEGPPFITLHTIDGSSQIEICVSDKGIGIAKDQQKHLFKKFFRVSTGNVHNVKGFGLGLHYVKRILDMHGWDIAVESMPAIGTTMKIIIPKKRNIV
jgi:two-component system phosphate regulon sensor histidine kinase PhoR